MAESKQEAWLRGSVDGYEPLLMPVVHSLIQAREEVEQLAATVPPEHVWRTPGGAASVGFHVRHLGAALDRLFTYARDEPLSDEQKAASRVEELPGEPPMPLTDVAAGTIAQIEAALAHLQNLKAPQLLETRAVGRLKLPSTRLGLLFHAAEHCTRHTGQAITTAKVLAGAQGAQG
jgi:uncharacterized damage-inducible protein DinB